MDDAPQLSFELATEADEPSTSHRYELICDDVLTALAGLQHRHYQLIISSPPYNIGKSYERDQRRSLQDYKTWIGEIAQKMVQILKDGGSLCWQTGSFVRDGEYLPLDIISYEIFHALGLKLRNRIIWRFNFGRNSDRRFSGRYETLLWFTKGDQYTFNLDPVRIPQLYPGKRHSSKKKVEKVGLLSGNPLGKNPSDYWEFSAENDFVQNPIWDLPNVKANHPEKTIHPCQFPIELAERCILAFTNGGDAILDPFVGVGASVIAAEKHKRRSTGIDRDADYIRIAETRLQELQNGTLQARLSGKPVLRPNKNQKVAQFPEEWVNLRSSNG